MQPTGTSFFSVVLFVPLLNALWTLLHTPSHLPLLYYRWFNDLFARGYLALRWVRLWMLQQLVASRMASFQPLACPVIPFSSHRPHMDKIVTLVQLMLESKFPCFRGQTIPQLKSADCHVIADFWVHHTHTSPLPPSLLRSRFNPSLSERDAAKFALSVVERACLSIRWGKFKYLVNISSIHVCVCVLHMSTFINKYPVCAGFFTCACRTRGYDVIQDVQQGIYYTKKIDNSWNMQQLCLAGTVCCV